MKLIDRCVKVFQKLRKYSHFNIISTPWVFFGTFFLLTFCTSLYFFKDDDDDEVDKVAVLALY